MSIRDEIRDRLMSIGGRPAKEKGFRLQYAEDLMMNLLSEEGVCVIIRQVPNVPMLYLIVNTGKHTVSFYIPRFD